MYLHERVVDANLICAEFHVVPMIESLSLYQES